MRSVTFTALCFCSAMLAVQASDADVARKELKDLLKGKSEGDILELRNQLKKSQKKRHHGHTGCPPGFGSQRSDGCCTSKWADDMTQAKYECQSANHWTISKVNHKKFICCPPKKDTKGSLKEELDELKRLVAQKDAASAGVEDADTDVVGGSRSRSRRISSEIEEDAREEMIERIDARQERQQMREWTEEAKRTADSESSFLMNFLWLLLAIPAALAIGVGYLMMIGSDLTAVQIPGLGTFNLQKIAKQTAKDLFGIGKSHVTKFIDSDDSQLNNPVQSSYGSYGGYGSSSALPSYGSSNMFGGAGESQALFAAAPAAVPKNNTAMPPVYDDLGL